MLTFIRLSHFRRIVNSSNEENVDLHRLANLALTGNRIVEHNADAKGYPTRTVYDRVHGNYYCDIFLQISLSGRNICMRSAVNIMYPVYCYRLNLVVRQ